MLSSLRAIAPRRLPCFVRTKLQLSSHANTSTLLLLSRPNTLLPLISKSQFHVSTILSRDAATAARPDTQDAEDDGLPTIKSSALQKLSMSPGKDTKNGDGLETMFVGLRDSGLIDKSVMKTIIEDMKYEEMTDVQVKTITPSLGSRDVLAQARTGTGKTLAFLLPTIQKILKHKAESSAPGQPPRSDPSGYGGGRLRANGVIDIRALVISPTRELALQIEKEAKRLCGNTSIAVQSAVGGTGKRDAMFRLRKEGCDLLVATPGRLLDLLQDPHSGVKLPNLDVYVLDEADSLLDQGFSQILKDINGELPDRRVKDRQTLFYSATFSKSVQDIARQTLKPDAMFVNTIDANEEPTHTRVPQVGLICRSFENVMPTLLELTVRERQLAEAEGKPFKAMVFANTTRGCSLNAHIFRRVQQAAQRDTDSTVGSALLNLEIHEIQGRLEQAQRTRVAEKFRKAKNSILFTSDVTARGMDFPNVTHIIQLGIMMSRESYIHRLGRTARGASTTTGKGFLITTFPETTVTNGLLKGLPINRETFEDDSLTLKCPFIDMSTASTIDRKTAGILTLVTEATGQIPQAEKTDAYLAMLGYYKGVRGSFGEFVRQMGRMCRFQWGMSGPVAVPPGLLQKMGINRREAQEYDVAIMDRDTDQLESAGGRSSGGRDFGGRGRDSSSGGRSGGFGGASRGGDRGDRGDRPPRRDFGSGDRSSSSSFGDRPPRRDFAGSRDRPSSSFGDRPPRRDFGSGDRPSFGDRPPRRDFGNSENRPPRREGSSSGERRPYGERPPRTEGGSGGFSDRGRTFGDKPRRFSSDRDEKYPSRQRSV